MPTHVLIPVAAILAQVSERTVARWEDRYGLGPFKPRPGCNQRHRLVEVARLEELLGESFSEERITTAIAQHAANKEERRFPHREISKEESEKGKATCPVESTTPSSLSGNGS